MRHRVCGRSRPVVQCEPLIQLHGVVFVHVSSQMAKETSASLCFLRRLPSRISGFDVNTEGLPHFLPHKHPALIGRHTGISI